MDLWQCKVARRAWFWHVVSQFTCYSFYEALRKSLFSAIEEFYPDFNEMANDKQFELLITAANGDADLCKVLSEYLIKCYDKREKIN